MTEYLTNDTDLKKIADAIRTKGGTSAPLVFPNGFASAISAIKTTPVLQSKTVTPSKDSQTIIADSPYDGLSQVVVNGDSNLISNNIKKGTTIFGVSGIYTGTTGENTIYCQAASYDSNYGVLLEFSYVPADPKQRIINLNFGSGIRARYNNSNFAYFYSLKYNQLWAYGIYYESATYSVLLTTAPRFVTSLDGNTTLVLPNQSFDNTGSLSALTDWTFDPSQIFLTY